MFVCVLQYVGCCEVVCYGSERRCVSASFLNVSVVFALTMCSGRLFQSHMVLGKNEYLWASELGVYVSYFWLCVLRVRGVFA